MIVDAALPLLLEYGETFKTHDVAVAAGIAEGTIFRVFASKEDLIRAAIDRALDPEPTERALAAIDVRAGLEATVLATVDLLQHRVAAVWQLLSGVGPRFHSHERRPSFDSPALAALLAAFGDELEVEPAEAARLLRSLTFAASHPLLTRQPLPPEKVARYFLHGAGRS